jgi:SAM-dependent methyltransferase
MAPRVADDSILANPYVTGKLLTPAHGDVLVLRSRSTAEPAAPPVELWEGYGANEQAYLDSGKRHVDEMLAILEKGGASHAEFRRVLDFGCAAGRMLRWMPRTETSVLWGTDIKGATISWCQQHLSPPLLFATTTTFPHLPFEDNYFDLVYAGSVFTHIIDLPDAWFLELRRVLRPGGYGFLTIFDKHGLERTLDPQRGGENWFTQQLRDFDARTAAFSQDFAYFSVDEGPADWNGMPVPQVCYDREYIVTRWSQLVDVVSVTEEGHDLQTAVAYRKR